MQECVILSSINWKTIHRSSAYRVRTSLASTSNWFTEDARVACAVSRSVSLKEIIFFDLALWVITVKVIRNVGHCYALVKFEVIRPKVYKKMKLQET